jgi:flagellin
MEEVMIINHNINALNAADNLRQTGVQLSASLAKLSSGLRINTAADDASGLAISEGMRAQVNGLNAAQLNAQEGLSAMQTAEGALNVVHTILQRVNYLAVRASNDATLSATDKGLMQSEVSQLTSELDRMSSTVTFNGKNLLDGSFTGQNLQVAEGSGGANQFAVDITGVSLSALGLTGIDVSTSASAAITLVNSAISTVSGNRGSIGAVMNRLQDTIDNLGVEIQNVTASESRIRDVDMATEMSNLTRLQILQQSGTSALSQANSNPQSVLKLLQ